MDEPRGRLWVAVLLLALLLHVVAALLGAGAERRTERAVGPPMEAGHAGLP